MRRTPERVAGQLVAHYEAAGELGRAAHYAEHAAARRSNWARRSGQLCTSGARVGTDAQRQLLLGEALLRGKAREAQVELEAALRGFEQVGDAVGMTRAYLAWP